MYNTIYGMYYRIDSVYVIYDRVFHLFWSGRSCTMCRCSDAEPKTYECLPDLQV